MNLNKFLSRAQFYIKRKLLERNFSSKDYWELRYQSHWDSGQGSYGESAKYKARVFNQILKDYNIQSVIELGCGDGHQLQFYEIPKYLGYDVSQTIIQKCIEQYKDDPTKTFAWYDPEGSDLSSDSKTADLAISVDVIFHLVEQPVFEKYLRDLFQLSDQYVAIYATNKDEENVERNVEMKN